jgi:hypothetical protein
VDINVRDIIHVAIHTIDLEPILFGLGLLQIEDSLGKIHFRPEKYRVIKTLRFRGHTVHEIQI